MAEGERQITNELLGSLVRARYGGAAAAAECADTPAPAHTHTDTHSDASSSQDEQASTTQATSESLRPDGSPIAASPAHEAGSASKPGSGSSGHPSDTFSHAHSHTPTPTSVLDRDLFECVLCLKVFLEPIALPCGHTYCRLCLARACESNPSCPMCRAPVYMSVRDAVPNLLLSRIIESHFGGDLAARRREAVEDAAVLNSQRLGLFIIREFDVRFPYGRIDLIVHEPRYLVLIQRCMESSAMFGIQAAVGDTGGIAVKIENVQRLPGVLTVSASPVTRYRIHSPPEAVPDTYGLMYAGVRFVEDQPTSVEQRVSRVDEGSIAWSRLSARACGVLRGMDSDAQRATHLRDVLAAAVTRMLATLSPAVVRDFTNRHGHAPASSGPGGNAEKWSYYLCNILALPRDALDLAFNTTNTVERLMLCYATLEVIELQIEAAGAVARDDDPSSQLNALRNVPASAAFRFFAAKRSTSLMENPFWSSIAIFAAIAVLLYFLLQHR